MGVGQTIPPRNSVQNHKESALHPDNKSLQRTNLQPDGCSSLQSHSKYGQKLQQAGYILHYYA